MSESAPSEAMAVLLVEDEDTLREALTELLKEDGFDVTAVASGEKAIEVFKAERTPIVISDIRMGEMSGLDLLAQIKAIDLDTIVVIMTSHASFDAATEALRSGADDFLTKPFDDLGDVSTVVGRAAERVRLIERNRLLARGLEDKAWQLTQSNSALIKLADNLREYANRDGLTGLFTHRLFRDALIRETTKASADAGIVSILFMDVDHFKTFNDTNGHQAGDEVLKGIAQIAQDNVKKPSFVARYGGEEFVALLPRIGKEEARRVAELMREAVEAYPFVGRESQPGGKVTLSLGVATFPDDGNDASSLIRYADIALYEAKDGGRNAICG